MKRKTLAFIAAFCVTITIVGCGSKQEEAEILTETTQTTQETSVEEETTESQTSFIAESDVEKSGTVETTTTVETETVTTTETETTTSETDEYVGESLYEVNIIGNCTNEVNDNITVFSVTNTSDKSYSLYPTNFEIGNFISNSSGCMNIEIRPEDAHFKPGETMYCYAGYDGDAPSAEMIHNLLEDKIEEENEYTDDFQFETASFTSDEFDQAIDFYYHPNLKGLYDMYMVMYFQSDTIVGVTHNLDTVNNERKAIINPYGADRIVICYKHM